MCAILSCFLLLAAGSPDASLLPAYAHNDYMNEYPLLDAIALGFRGVEVDYFVVDGELRVGHDLDETEPGRTVEPLYLAPLRAYLGDGAPHYENQPFILNIESKREGMEAYDALHQLLSRYEDILTTVRDGVEQPGPVQVILVGWHPPLEYLRNQPVRYAAVQMHYTELPPDHAQYPAHLVRLISQNYNAKLLARGRRPVSKRLQERFRDVAHAAHEVPGRLARVYGTPTSATVYSAILDAGIDLIGTKDIVGANALLTRER
jgi:glycerophosphoryl diester phosphodiesterase